MSGRHYLKPLPLGLLGMIAMVVGIEGYIALHGEAFLSHDAWGWRQSTAKASRPDPKTAIFCFGDSQVKWGIAPIVIERLTRQPTYNVSMSGGPAPASYFLLRRVLASGVRPKAVVVDFIPSLLVTDASRGSQLLTEVASLGDALDLALTACDASLFGKIALPGLLPSARARFAIRTKFQDLLQGTKMARLNRVLPKVRRNLDVNNGGILMRSKPLLTEEYEPSRAFFPADWTCHPVQRTYVERFLTLASTKGIPTFWIIPPVPPALQADCERCGFAGRFTQFVRDIQARHPDVTVVDARPGAFDPSMFTDWIHLGRDGAVRLSAEVASVVNRRLSKAEAVSWVALRESHGPPVDLPLEDLEQSRLALQQEGEKRRR